MDPAPFGGWGYGADEPITGKKLSNTSGYDYFTITYNLMFTANGQSATGTIYVVSPVGPKPK